MKRQLTTGLGNNSLSVRDGASALFRRRALVLFIFLAVLAGAIGVTVLLPNRYSARMKILVKNQRVDLAITP
ncbi:MAG TPA: Wzz/FepE/Etk N-terminal domain-containing protein, partial [Pyrinomonadaceae bacterium]|nr:Wzz/FepE/Etk N-terminal domain-containing protein [Pyrinomonadaceae bacterium]